MQSKRLDYIDMAKALALVLVFLSHSDAPELMFWANAFFIPIFFVCSGYTTTKGISIRKKFVRLIVSYFALNILLLILPIISHSITWNSILGIVYGRYSVFPITCGAEKNQMLQNYNAPTWFLPAMFMAFVFLKGIMFFEKVKWQLAIIALYIVISYACTLLPILLPWSLDTALVFAVLCYIGMQLRKFEMVTSWRIALISVVVYVLSAKYNGLINLSVRDYGCNVILMLIAGVSGSVAFIYLCWLCCKCMRTQLFSKFNRHAMVLFCIQIPLIGYSVGAVRRIMYLCGCEYMLTGGYGYGRGLNSHGCWYTGSHAY